jgi:hypothetical protein
VKIDTIRKTIYDTTRVVVGVVDTVRIPGTGVVSVKDFGARCDGVADDFIADSIAIAFCIANPQVCSTVYFPVGHSRISRPLILSNSGRFFTIRLTGALPAKSAPDAYLSTIICDYKAGPGIGIQLGRGIIIENLAILGKYSFPYSITNKTIGTTTFDQWNDGSVSDSRYSPYAGIVIDPFVNASGSAGGTSGVEIRQCSIKQFMVGICLTPNPVTANDEMINIIDCDIDAVRVAVAIGQDQSKEIHIDRLKCWASTHTILDGVHYGKGTGGGSVMIEGMNIAGNVNQLFNVVNDRFPLSAKDIYSESLFRIGTVGGSAGANFINFQIDFLTGGGMPAADYLINGGGNFYGGILRYYDNQPTHRMNFVNTGSVFRDMVLGTPPIVIGLYGGSVYPQPQFCNVHLYGAGKPLSLPYDTLIPLPRSYALIIDRNTWTGTITGIDALPGDYILGSPTSTSGKFFDAALNANACRTIQIGRVTSVSAGTVFLDDIGVNVSSGMGFDGIYILRMK